MRKLALLLLPLLLLSGMVFGGGENPFIEKHMAAARRLMDAGKTAEARFEVERALERDDQHLGALLMWSEVASAAGDTDAAVFALHSWLEVVRAAEKTPVSRAVVKEVEARLLGLDENAATFRKLTDTYIKELMKIEKEHTKSQRYHSALAVIDEALHIDPHNAAARARRKEIQREGGADVATEDMYAGSDPTVGVDPEWIADENAKHTEWKSAWRKETDYYRIRTNGGYLIMQTAGIAMDQMNMAYRHFFHYKEDGGSIPKIDVHVFKNRDEYLTLGQGPPVEWSAGHFTGSAVETYVGGTEGTDGIKEMYSTLFHEAAHQFVSLTGKGGVPGWLNEAYASFFEGTTILSNGTVRWNRVNNGRLFALAPRLEAGWMEDHNDGVRGDDGDWGAPERAPSLRILIENRYQWGPPWYAPTWGVVYFLYNYRDPDTGIAVLREPLHAYYLSGAGSVGESRRVEHFEEMVLSGERSPVKTVDELSEIWAEWLLDLRDRQIGQGEPEQDLLHYADLALSRNDAVLAMSLLEEAILYAPDNPEIQWELAKLLHEDKQDDRASAYYRSFANELALRGEMADGRFATARRLMEELDPLFKKHKRLKLKLGEDGLVLARSYRAKKMPRMAMEIARRMSASWSLPEALELYTEIARESGISLARWKIAYNELTLDGWQPNKSYLAYGKMVQAFVKNDAAIDTPEGMFQTQELAADVVFDADYSLEAEMRFGTNAGFMGLCFGRKDGSNTQAIGLHPKGSIDISTKSGGNWITRDHQQVTLVSGWHKLRIDVVTQAGPNAVVDVHFDDLFMRSLEMPRDSVRGSFGLITGTGGGEYRNIRILKRDPHDPAARIERELALQARLEDPAARTPGVFQGIKPPVLADYQGEWLQGEPLAVANHFGHPMVISFWTPRQDELIPTADYYAHLVEKWQQFDMEVIVICTNTFTAAQIHEWLVTHPMPGVRVLFDQGFLIYPAFHVGSGGWEIPRNILVDVDGTVYWEGDLNLRLNEGWVRGSSGNTPLDLSIEALVSKRKLRQLDQLVANLATATALFEKGLLSEALKQIAPLADLEADFDERVREARHLRDTIESIGAALPVRASVAMDNDQLLLADALLKRAAHEFPNTGVADLSLSRLRSLQRDPRYRDVSKAWNTLERAFQYAERGKENADIEENLAKALAISDGVEVIQIVATLRALLAEGGAAAFAKAWPALQPAAKALAE